MPREMRVLTRSDILPPLQYAQERGSERQRIAALKRRRRVEVGPFVTCHFENYETMRHQVQEMLFIEKGGEAQIEGELGAYNPLIPKENELSATVMIEIDDATRRRAELSRLGGIEDAAFLEIAGRRIKGEADTSRENTSPEGRASAVQFVKFRLDLKAGVRFRTPGERVLLGFDHPNYGHLAVLPEETRKALAEEKKGHSGGEEAEYPSNALALHRAAILAAEERFYGELEKLVQKAHPERARKRDDED